MSTRLTQEELIGLLRYDPVTGHLLWRKGRKGVAANTLAGSLRPDGYWRIGIYGVAYRAARLVWLFHHGTWPTGQIDHINGNKLDNRIENLRDVTHSVNLRNQFRAHKTNRIGLLGVYESNKGRYRADIQVSGCTMHLGTFSTPQEAHNAYLEMKALRDK